MNPLSILHAVEYWVSSADEIENTMKIAEPGDVLIMTNGIWIDQRIEFEGEGTEQDSIYLRAETPGQVIISGKSNFRLSGQYLVVDGLYFFNGYSPSGAVFEFRGDIGSAQHCRLTGTAFVNFNPLSDSKDYKWLSMYGSHNRVDHCYFAGKNHSGTTLVVWFDRQSSPPAHYHQIDHNYFGYRPPLGYNGGETIRIGTSTYSMNNSRTVVEYNYFERCNGEVEIISNKSCENIYQHNTFYECEGALVLRHGNRNIVRGNFFFGNKKDMTGGVRIIGEDQTVINNYFEGLYGEDWYAALPIMDGVPNSPLNRYFQVQRALIAFNTFVDCRQSLLFGLASSVGDCILPPLDCVIANNLVKSGDTLIHKFSEPINLTWEGNLMEGDLGITQPPGITLTNLNLFFSIDSLWRIDETSPAFNSAVGSYPDILVDMDGQPRDALKDVGSDEVSTVLVQIQPLTADDVGPTWLKSVDSFYIVAVSVEGTGNVVMDPTGGLYPAGTWVRLTAVPGFESTFEYWTGDLTGNNNPDSILVNNHMTITAHFNDPAYYDISSWITGSGHIELSPSDGPYKEGSQVIVTAVPDPGWGFVSWGSSLSGSKNPDTLIMDSNKSLTALFQENTGITRIGVDEPLNNRLYPNYPNPFNAYTTIFFSLRETGWTSLTLYNTLGQKKDVIFESLLDAGHHELKLNASHLSSGIYYVYLKSNNYHEKLKMILLK